MQKYIVTEYQKPGERPEKSTLKQVFYLASDVDARIAEYEDLLRRSGLALSGVAGQMSQEFVSKLLADMQAFTTRIHKERHAH